jgi:hypothetical protein
VKAKLQSVCFILILLSVSMFTAAVRPVSAQMFHDKAAMTQMWKNLCDAHPFAAHYEIIGKSLQGRDIWLFKIGNPYGGAIMWDGQTHGPEDSGSECGYLFAKWLLESSDPMAIRIMERNCWLFIPIINVDSTARQNMRRSYTLPNGTVIDVPYGVDLNRNGVASFGGSGSGNPNNNYEYRGLYGGSEPETRAIRYAMEKYRPRIYVNTHNGGEYLLYYGPRTAIENSIISLYATFSNASGIPRYYSTQSASPGGFVMSDAHSFGASAWLWEIIKWENITTYDDFVAQWYPRVEPMMLAMSEAAGIDNPTPIPGDIDLNGTVDLNDAMLLALAYGSTPGKPNWNPRADLDLDNTITICDAIVLATHYNQRYP